MKKKIVLGILATINCCAIILSMEQKLKKNEATSVSQETDTDEILKGLNTILKDRFDCITKLRELRRKTPSLQNHPEKKYIQLLQTHIDIHLRAAHISHQHANAEYWSKRRELAQAHLRYANHSMGLADILLFKYEEQVKELESVSQKPEDAKHTFLESATKENCNPRAKL